jgi:hypothetical protein
MLAEPPLGNRMHRALPNDSATLVALDGLSTRGENSRTRGALPILRDTNTDPRMLQFLALVFQPSIITSAELRQSRFDAAPRLEP